MTAKPFTAVLAALTAVLCAAGYALAGAVGVGLVLGAVATLSLFVAAHLILCVRHDRAERERAQMAEEVASWEPLEEFCSAEMRRREAEEQAAGEREELRGILLALSDIRRNAAGKEMP